MLSKADSNHYKQNQNLLCYHYTIGQSRVQRSNHYKQNQNLLCYHYTIGQSRVQR